MPEMFYFSQIAAAHISMKPIFQAFVFRQYHYSNRALRQSCLGQQARNLRDIFFYNGTVAETNCSPLRREHCFPEFLDAFFLWGDGPYYVDSEEAFKNVDINGYTFIHRLVYHIEIQGHRKTHLRNLQGNKQ